VKGRNNDANHAGTNAERVSHFSKANYPSRKYKLKTNNDELIYRAAGLERRTEMEVMHRNAWLS
jgi:hypothetical protein